MLCPSCGTDHSLEGCLQPVTDIAAAQSLTEQELHLEETNVPTTPETLGGGDAEPSLIANQPSRLIEFPGVTRRSVPQWRKELSERVRDLQERREREAAMEAELAQQQRAELGDQLEEVRPPQLNLLPQAEASPLNPIVAAALKRIERANQPTAARLQRGAYAARATAGVASNTRNARPEVATNNAPQARAATARMFEENLKDDPLEGDILSAAANKPSAGSTPAPARDVRPITEPAPEPTPERTHNLVVVPAAAVAQSNVSQTDTHAEKPKPRRVISDDASDPVLNYLDLIGLTHSATADSENRAPLFARLMAGVIDLIGVCFLSVPFAAVIELQNDSWREPRILGFMGGVVIAVMFFYLTVSTALTGKTLGLRILSLRVVDARTGLIPTGNQAAGRALVFILSLATAGLGFLLALTRGEGKTAHDRLSRTAVVRD